MRIALLFEYPTLNGGERSMLAVIDQLRAGGVSPPHDRRESRDEFAGDTGDPRVQSAAPVSIAGATRPRHTREFDFLAIAPETGPLADALRERGIEVHPLRIRDDAGKRLPPETAAANLRATLETCDADLIHANSLAMGRLTGGLGDDFPIPRIAHLRDIIKLSAAAIADLNRNNRLIAVSHATREFHVAQGLDPAKTQVIYNGVDFETSPPKPAGRARRDLRAELKLPEDAFVVLAVGQIGLRKGQDLLAEAAVSLKHSCEAASGEMHYLIVGERHSNKPESIEFERNIARRFADARMADRLHLLGYRHDVPRLMHAADLLVHPAHQEPLGRVLLEAAESGLPIVATAVGGTTEILTDGVSARLVSPGDPAALAAAIVELAKSFRLRENFSAAARKRVESQFSIAEAAAALSSLWLATAGCGDHA